MAYSQPSTVTIGELLEASAYWNAFITANMTHLGSTHDHGSASHGLTTLGNSGGVVSALLTDGSEPSAPGAGKTIVFSMGGRTYQKSGASGSREQLEVTSHVHFPPSFFTDLVGWWDFGLDHSEETGTFATVTDASGNGNTMTLTGSASDEAFPNGKVGCRLAAIGDYFTSSLIPATGTGHRTLAAVVYNVQNASSYDHIMQYGTAVSQQASGIAGYSGGFRSHEWSHTDTLAVSDMIDETGDDGVAVVFYRYDGTNIMIDVYRWDGQVVSVSTAYALMNTGSTVGLRIGERISAGSEHGDMVYGECMAWSDDLSDAEMELEARRLLARWAI